MGIVDLKRVEIQYFVIAFHNNHYGLPEIIGRGVLRGTDTWPDSGALPVIKDDRAVACTASGSYRGPEIMID